MYVEIVPNRNSPPAILLREGWREGGKSRKRTLANLSNWPAHKIAMLRKVLRNETLVSPDKAFETTKTLPHGHVEAVLGTIRKLGLDRIVLDEYPGERLVACFNPLLADERRSKREALLSATEKDLEKLSKQVLRRKKKPMKASEIGLKAGKVQGRYKMSKHFRLTIEDGRFQWERNADTIQQEAQLDGIYVIRTSEPEDRLTAEETVRRYKSLSHVERTFRAMKGIDILVHPIRHRTSERVPAHIFLCMLAYYVQWHMRRALAPILFEDHELPVGRKMRDPVLSAEASESAKTKKASRRTFDGFVVHSFRTLLFELSCRARITCRMISDAGGPTFRQITKPTNLQAKALELLGLFP